MKALRLPLSTHHENVESLLHGGRLTFDFLRKDSDSEPVRNLVGYETEVQGDLKSAGTGLSRMVDASGLERHTDSLRLLRRQAARAPVRRDEDLQTGAMDANPFDFFEVRRSPTKDRKAVASISVGEKFSGRVVGISLYDGLRVDIGAQIDALVPVDYSRDGVKPSVRLGDTLKIKIVEVYTGISEDARRFPLVATTLEKGEAEDVSSEVGSALRFRPGDDSKSLQVARGKEISANVVAAPPCDQDSDDSEQEPALTSMPPRPAPEKVLTLDADGTARWVKVPAEYRQPPREASASTKEAWRRRATEELALVGQEVQCRRQLAMDLDIVEDDLAAGRMPSVPTALIGLTPSADGQGAVLPFTNGDALCFRHLEANVGEEVRREHELHRSRWAKGALPESRRLDLEALRQLFSCAGVRHARAVYAAEGHGLSKMSDLGDFDGSWSIEEEDALKAAVWSCSETADLN